MCECGRRIVERTHWLNMRPLYLLEKYFWERSRQHFHPGFIVAVTLNEAIPDDVLSEAIRLTGVDNAMLFQRVQEQDGERPDCVVPIGKRLLAEDVIVHVDTLDPNHLFQTVKFSLTEDAASWRLFVKGNEMVLFLDHTFFDGMSAYNILKSVIQYSNQGVSSGNGLVYDDTSAPLLKGEHAYADLPVPLSQRIMAKAVPFWIQTVEPLLSKILPSNTFTIPTLNVQDELFDDEGKVRNTNYRHVYHIKPDDLKDVLGECRQHKVTLTSYFCAKFIGQLKQMKGKTTGTVFTVSIPINTRKYLSETLNKDIKTFAVGNHVASFDCKIDTNKNHSDFWAICQDFQGQLDKTKNEPGDAVGFIKLLESVDIAKFVNSQYDKTVPKGAFEISNLGAFDPSSADDKYQVLDAQFHLPRLPQNVFSCSAISTRLGGANVVISYPPSLAEVLTPLFESI